MHRPAWQCSNYSQSNINYAVQASNAVDGDTNDNLVAGDSCTNTFSQAWPWWTVDLGAVTAVKAVMITNRGDCCCELALFTPRELPSC